jgi:hypothetical protein
MRLTRVTALDELLDKIPDMCPLLQTPLEWSREDRGFESFSTNSPSIDRIDNSKGSRVVFGHFEQHQLTFLFFRLHLWKRLDYFQACQHN